MVIHPPCERAREIARKSSFKPHDSKSTKRLVMSQPSAAEQPAFTSCFRRFQQLMTSNSAVKVASAEARPLESTRFDMSRLTTDVFWKLNMVVPSADVVVQPLQGPCTFHSNSPSPDSTRWIRLIS
jgi:hypothetical protein